MNVMWCIGIHISPSFFEISALEIENQNCLRQIFHRSCLLKVGLQEGLSQFFQQYPEIKDKMVLISSDFVKKFFHSKPSQSQALIVTKGTEDWFASQQTHPMKNSLKFPHIIRRELVFGISERSNADGKSIRPVPIDELEFIAAKLKLSGIQRVTISLMHSLRNSDNLEFVSHFFKNQGFEVFSRRLSNSGTELQHTKNLLLSQQLTSPFREHQKEVVAALEGIAEPDQILFLNGEGDPFINESENISSALFASLFCLQKFTQKLPNASNSLALDLQYDQWTLLDPVSMNNLWKSPWGDISCPHVRHWDAIRQPQDVFQLDHWGLVSPTSSTSLYDSGSLFMGRSNKVFILDLIAALNPHLLKENFFSHDPWPIFERYMDSLQRPSTTMNEMNAVEFKIFLFDQILIELLRQTLQEKYIQHLYLSGPLAVFFQPTLAQMAPWMNVSIVPQSNHIRSFTTASLHAEIRGLL